MECIDYRWCMKSMEIEMHWIMMMMECLVSRVCIQYEAFLTKFRCKCYWRGLKQNFVTFTSMTEYVNYFTNALERCCLMEPWLHKVHKMDQLERRFRNFQANAYNRCKFPWKKCLQNTEAWKQHKMLDQEKMNYFS